MFKLFFPDAGKMMTRALREYRDATTTKDVPEILNNEGLNVARETMRRIPKASAADITKDMGTVNAPSRLAYRLAVKSLGPGKKKSDYTKKAKAIVRARKRSIAYIKAGQIPIIKAFGGSGKDPSAKSYAAKSKGDKARGNQSTPTAKLSNKARGAGKVGAPALEGALRFRASRLESSARGKMQKTARKFSGR